MSVLQSILDALETAGIDRVYALGKVPPKPGYPYAVVSIAPAAPQIRRLSGSGDPVGRFTVQHFGRSPESISHDEGISGLTFAAFDGKPLTDVDGEPVAWQEIATAPYRDSDDKGVLNVLHTYRY